jgi:hypothetical protein
MNNDPERSEAAKAAEPPTGFMLFAFEERPKLKANHPEMTFAEMGKALGAAWKALSAAEQAKYTKVNK